METKYKNKKYRILETLNTNFSKDEAKKKKLKIIKTLPVSPSTFKNWLYIKTDDIAEISYVNLKKIATILEVQIDALINFEINI